MALADAVHAQKIWTTYEIGNDIIDPTPPCHLTIMLTQRAKWHEFPGVCPRCGGVVSRAEGTHIIDHGTDGLCCSLCDGTP